MDIINMSSSTMPVKKQTPQEKQYIHISEWIKNHPNKDIEQEIINHQNIVSKLAYVYSYNNKQLYKNLFAEGLLGLLIAITKYKDTKNANIKTYIYLWAKAKILRFLDKEVYKNKTMSMESINDNFGHSSKLTETFGIDMNETILQENLRNEFMKIINELPTNQYLIIQRRYFEEPPLKIEEIEKLLGISRSYIRVLENKAITYLKKNLYKISIKN